ncbi:MAG: hypothetical protein M1482_11400 [Chloroflexi bacterium]|nr:hypothetical protein [Chloroflexota bacterium]
MRRTIQHLTPFRIFLIALAASVVVGVTATRVRAGGYGDRLSNGSFEEGFEPNGVAANWVGFDNGGSAFYHFQDDTAPAFAFDGGHSQLIEISTMNYYATEPERYAGIYQTVAVAAGTSYTLTLRGMLRVLPDDPDMNNWSYIVQWGIDPTGRTDWGAVAWKDVPWQNTYDWQKPGPLSSYTTAFTAPSDRITLFVRALKKFGTNFRDLFVNLDGISLNGLLYGVNGPPQVDVKWPTFVYTGKPFPVHVVATDTVGIPSLKLFDDDKLAASVDHAVGPLSEQTDFAWTPAISGTHTLTLQAQNQFGTTTTVTSTIDVQPIAEFFRNGNFEGGFVGSAIANAWGFFNNGGRDVSQAPYDDNWPPVVAGGSHSQLIEINTTMYGEHDPYQEPDRYAGICQVVSGLTPGASYYVDGRGLLRISEIEDPVHLDDWSYVAEWGYGSGASPDCGGWSSVSNWQMIPWGHVDYRESPTKINSFSYVLLAPSETLTVYFRAWKKWAIGAREMLLNLDNLSFEGYKAPPTPTMTPSPTPTSPPPTTVTPTQSTTPAPSATPTATATPGR